MQVVGNRGINLLKAQFWINRCDILWTVPSQEGFQDVINPYPMPLQPNVIRSKKIEVIF